MSPATNLFKQYLIEPIVHQRWSKPGEPGENPPDHAYVELGFPTCNPSEALTAGVRNLMD